MIHNKLVRDKIPEIIAESGRKCKTKVLSEKDYIFELERKLSAVGIRVTCDTRNEKIGYKIREAQTEKVPYMLVMGDKEVEEGAVSVRLRSVGDKGTMSAEEFIKKVCYESAAMLNNLE